MMAENNKIRLFVDAHVFDEQYQGSRTFIKEIYAILAQKKDIDLFLGAYDIENLKKNFRDSENISFVKYKTTSAIARLAYEIPSIINRYKIQYAHFQYIAPPIKNCKFIVTVHDVIFSEYPNEFSVFYRLSKKFLYKTSASRADIVTTVSAYSKNSIEKYLRINPKNIFIIPNGVNVKFFETYDKQIAKKYIKARYGFEKFILFISRIEPRKNHVLLLKAYLQLKLYSKGYWLVLLGTRSMRSPEFDRMMNELPQKIGQYIFIKNDIGDEDLLEFYRAATAFVYPSKAEGFGIPPLEAAALKIPVLCSHSSAMNEYSFFGENHIDPLDYDVFKNKLQEVIDGSPDEDHQNNLSELIRKDYSWIQSAEKLYKVIVSNADRES